MYRQNKITPETSEKSVIKDYFRLKGVFFYHNLAGVGTYPGLPDLTAIHYGQVYMIEVKAKGGRQREDQKLFQSDWESNGGVYILGGFDEVRNVMRI